MSDLLQRRPVATLPPPSPLAMLPGEESAEQTLWRGQGLALAVAGVVVLCGLVVVRPAMLAALVSAATLMYLATGIYKIYVLYIALRYGTPEAPPLTLADVDLPLYTVLVPLFREAAIIPGLLVALSALDYPPEKMQVLLLLEEDDDETIAACKARPLPGHVTPLVVPPGTPRTKPRACNHGLAAARGDYLVIYDAEDRPQPDQLRKALAAFLVAAPLVACQQAKLEYYNVRQNVLTRLFTIEYANWFDGMLPGLTRLGAPIPLGGTSNHFRVATLRALGGWDPYNVAEDADLGIRLARHGYRTAVFNSLTWEEANSKVPNWIRQRSRWVKGYMQTLLVHTRHPRRTWRELGTRDMLSFLSLVGGTPLAALLNPIFWALGVVYYTTRSTAIEQLFPTPIYYAGLGALILGNFIFVFTNVFTAVHWEYDDLVKWALLSPFYWLLFSVASYMALWELITRPHYWQKTEHGLTGDAAHADPPPVLEQA